MKIPSQSEMGGVEPVLPELSNVIDEYSQEAIIARAIQRLNAPEQPTIIFSEAAKNYLHNSDPEKQNPLRELGIHRETRLDGLGRAVTVFVHSETRDHTHIRRPPREAPTRRKK